MKNLIFQTQYWNIILADDQTYFGRCVVVLKRPCGTLAEITADELTDFHRVVKKFESVFKKEYGAVMFNYSCLMNDAYQRTPPDPQVHWHFRPRYDKPVIFQGVEFIDPNFAHHYQREPKRKLDVDLEQKLINDLQLKFAL